MLTLAEMYKAAQVAALAYVLSILFEEGQIFAAWGRLLTRNRFDWPNLTKALGLCLRCLAGQMALWIGALYCYLPPFKLLLFIAAAIFFSEIINKFLGGYDKTH